MYKQVKTEGKNNCKVLEVSVLYKYLRYRVDKTVATVKENTSKASSFRL